METLASKIKSLRTHIGFSQEELGNRVGVSLHTVFRWEKGERAPSADELVLLAQALNTTVAYLVGETQNVSLSAKEDNVSHAVFEACPEGKLPQEVVVIERGEGSAKTRVVLPMTLESYRLAVEQLDRAIDPQLQVLIDLWEKADTETRDAAFRALSGNQQEKIKGEAGGGELERVGGG